MHKCNLNQMTAFFLFSLNLKITEQVSFSVVKQLAAFSKEFQTVQHQSVNSYQVLQGQDVILKLVAIRQKSCYFQIISQHTQRGLFSLRSKMSLLWLGQGLHPRHPRKRHNRKIKDFPVMPLPCNTKGRLNNE